MAILEESAIEALERQREHLREARKRLDDLKGNIGQRLHAIEVLLQPLEHLEGLANIEANGHGPVRGLKRTICAILESHPDGRCVAEITEDLKGRGFAQTNGARTTLMTRVRNELQRMISKEEASRVARGKYTIAKRKDA